ncbi:hypothetical protein LV779_05680, partial [Streptomyces thinghirensis]|nr:hypothetical protein [Streptomyces thinghirensis]
LYADVLARVLARGRPRAQNCLHCYLATRRPRSVLRHYSVLRWQRRAARCKKKKKKKKSGVFFFFFFPPPPSLSLLSLPPHQE